MQKMNMSTDMAVSIEHSMKYWDVSDYASNAQGVRMMWEAVHYLGSKSRSSIAHCIEKRSPYRS
jgi:hypothetical protein